MNIKKLVSLEEYLTRERMTVKEFSKLSGISRQTLWHIRIGHKVYVETMTRVFDLTKGQVLLPIKTKGRPKLSTDPH